MAADVVDTHSDTLSPDTPIWIPPNGAFVVFSLPKNPLLTLPGTLAQNAIVTLESAPSVAAIPTARPN
jgi:hypothetical protein